MSGAASAFPTLSLPISVHAQYIFEEIYKKKHGQSAHLSVHGTLHASRVAFYIPLIEKLYRGLDSSIPALSEEDLKLTQIAGLFHDMAREDDGVDRWDLDSAKLCFQYLLSIGVDFERAVTYAEVIANKDEHKEGRYFLNRDSVATTSKLNLVRLSSNALFSQRVVPEVTRSLPEEYLNLSDLLDILRCQSAFMMNHESNGFYKRFQGSIPVQYFAFLRDEIFRFIHSQGDVEYFKKRIPSPHERQADCFERVLASVEARDEEGRLCFPLLHALHHAEEHDWIDVMLPTESGRALLQTSQIYTDRGPPVLVRGIVNPLDPERGINLELEHATAPGGNPNRCISIIGPGTQLLWSVNLLLREDIELSHISFSDAGSGYGERLEQYVKRIVRTYKAPPQTRSLRTPLEEIREKIALEYPSLKMGDNKLRNTELTASSYNLSDVRGVVYSLDPLTSLNRGSNFSSGPKDFYAFSVRLSVLVLVEQIIQKQRESTEKIPIFEYSAMRGTLVKVVDDAMDSLDHLKQALIEEVKPSIRQYFLETVFGPEGDYNNRAYRLNVCGYLDRLGCFREREESGVYGEIVSALGEEEQKIREEISIRLLESLERDFDERVSEKILYYHIAVILDDFKRIHYLCSCTHEPESVAKGMEGFERQLGALEPLLLEELPSKIWNNHQKMELLSLLKQMLRLQKQRGIALSEKAQIFIKGIFEKELVNIDPRAPCTLEHCLELFCQEPKGEEFNIKKMQAYIIQSANTFNYQSRGPVDTLSALMPVLEKIKDSGIVTEAFLSELYDKYHQSCEESRHFEAWNGLSKLFVLFKAGERGPGRGQCIDHLNLSFLTFLRNCSFSSGSGQRYFFWSIMRDFLTHYKNLNVDLPKISEAYLKTVREFFSTNIDVSECCMETQEEFVLPFKLLKEMRFHQLIGAEELEKLCTKLSQYLGDLEHKANSSPATQGDFQQLLRGLWKRMSEAPLPEISEVLKIEDLIDQIKQTSVSPPLPFFEDVRGRSDAFDERDDPRKNPFSQDGEEWKLD